MKQAAAALGEIKAADPNVPELKELTASFDELRRSVSTAHRGRWLVAAAVFAVSCFGGSWRQESGPLASAPIAAAVDAVKPATPKAIGTRGAIAHGSRDSRSKVHPSHAIEAKPRAATPHLREAARDVKVDSAR